MSHYWPKKPQLAPRAGLRYLAIMAGRIEWDTTYASLRVESGVLIGTFKLIRIFNTLFYHDSTNGRLVHPTQVWTANQA